MRGAAAISAAAMLLAGTAAGQDASAAPRSPGLSAFIGQADGWLLAGRAAPPELPRLLLPLVPADRLTAVAYLRRLGVLDGPALDLGLLLGAPQGPAT